MKKLFFTLLTLCLCGATWAAYDFSAPTVDAGGSETDTLLYYSYVNEEEKTVKVTYSTSSLPSQATHSSYVGAITIPSSVTYDGTTYSVVEIGSRAFRYCTDLTSVVIPEGVTSIDDDYVFASCTGLTYVGLPSTMTYIGEYAFEYCESLETVTLPDGLTGIGRSAFLGCTSLEGDIVIPEGISEVNNSLFNGCEKITSVVFSEGVTTIGQSVFLDATALTSVTFPSTMTSLGLNAFNGCTSLKEITFAKGMNCTFSNAIFEGCTSLTEVVFPEVTYLALGNRTFQDCTNLTSVILMDSDPSHYSFTGQAGAATDVFRDDSGITFYVPRGSAAQYAASYWATEAQTDNDSFNFFSISIDKIYTDGSYYYATYYMDEANYEVDVPSTSTLYAVTSVSDGVADMEKLEGDIIPSGTPLIIKASDSDSGTTSVTYYFWRDYYETDEEGNVTPYFSESPSTISVPEGNMLYGHSTQAYTCAANGDYDSSKVDGYLFYKLSLDSNYSDNSIGFYYGATDGASYQASAHRCWLAVPSGNHPPVISIKKDGDTTGISSVESATEGATVKGIYTVQGVRVSNMNQPGLYIVDGKKVLVK